ncbi:MAG: GNAT family N-acetyltransferase [Bacteroidia bacterium]|nr:GNAT family N-acetyltransferase [Bacteroidia bacterium]
MLLYFIGENMLINYPTGKDFFEDNAAFILSDELRHQFLFINAKQAWNTKSCPEHFYLKIVNGNSTLYAIKNKPYPLVIIGVRFLIKELVENLLILNYDFTEIIADEATCRVFMDEYRVVKGGTFRLKTAMSTMVFKGVGKFDEHVQACADKDTPFIASCIQAFHKEIWNEDVTYESSLNKVKEYDSGLFGYYVDNRLVSILLMSRETNHHVSMSLAYTIPEERCKGYIQKLMLHCAKLVADRGKIAHLHVDKANPVSNHAYSKIGFVYDYDESCYEYIAK